MPHLMVFLFLLLLSHSFSSGKVEGAEGVEKPFYPFHMSTVQVMNGRKLMVDDAALFDYEEGGPNPRHDPRKPKPAGVDKNP
ncbi:hypothetical protein MRB53_035754 [Persea americana]|uniref:Uncharacterized protein n=1 Tax=Persea americana TaxID=3435 RepID=A0ACC2K5Z5_PERAE|nr:hypothetical protein MRB53_035754 [Persea americana]